MPKRPIDGRRPGSAASDGRSGEQAIEPVVAESLAHLTAVAEAAHDATQMAVEGLRHLAELLDANARQDGADGCAPMPALPADVLEVAALGAQLGGVDIDEFLRAAVLAYSASQDGASGADGAQDLHARLQAARREARRVQAESRAVQAQSSRAIGRAKKQAATRDGRRDA